LAVYLARRHASGKGLASIARIDKFNGIPWSRLSDRIWSIRAIIWAAVPTLGVCGSMAYPASARATSNPKCGTFVPKHDRILTVGRIGVIGTTMRV